MLVSRSTNYSCSPNSLHSGELNLTIFADQWRHAELQRCGGNHPIRQIGHLISRNVSNRLDHGSGQVNRDKWRVATTQRGVELGLQIGWDTPLFLKIKNLHQAYSRDIDDALTCVTRVKHLTRPRAQSRIIFQKPDQAMGIGHSVHQMSSDGKWPHICRRASSISSSVMFKPRHSPRKGGRGSGVGSRSAFSNSGRTRTTTRNLSRGGNWRSNSITLSVVTFDSAIVLLTSKVPSRQRGFRALISTSFYEFKFIVHSQPAECPVKKPCLRAKSLRPENDLGQLPLSGLRKMPSDAKTDTDMGLNILMPRGRYRRAAASSAHLSFRVFRVFRGLFRGPFRGPFRGLFSQESALGNGTPRRMDMR